MSYFNWVLFSEVSPLINKAKKKHIEENDLLVLPAELHPENILVPVGEIRWTTPLALLFSMLKSMRRYLVPAYAWYIVSILAALSTPVLVNKFVTLISRGVTAENLQATLTYGLVLGLCGFAAGWCLQQYFYRVLKANQVGTNIVNERIFKHSLRLCQNARQKSQLGDVVNHMSSDSDAVTDFPQVIADLVTSAFEIVVVVGMLFYYIGWSALAALLVLFTLLPLTQYVAKRFTKLEEEMMNYRDQRVTLMSQTLSAIRVVKYFAWEKSVSREVMDIRDKELLSRRRLAKAETMASMGYLGVSTFVLFVALAAHSLRGQSLDAALIFTCISLFGLLEGPFGDMSHLISRGTASRVGARRILNFLNLERLEIPEGTLDKSGKPIGLEIENLTVKYPGAKAPTLRNIQFDVPAGKSVAIVGPVGSGKSSLLNSILGEFLFESGRVRFQMDREDLLPRLAYVPQEAYIINSSLLENLHFGEDVTNEEVRRSLDNSCLSQDLRQWPGGLRTEIGEKGVNLSGGQKQRVALARAILSKPQIVLLDDPLSAVDAETEDQLCDRLLFGAWKNVTRVVVTHRLEHLSQFDHVIFLSEGVIQCQGTFAELYSTCGGFAEFYAEHEKSQGPKHSGEVSQSTAAETAATKSEEHLDARVTEDEEKEVGAVKGSVYGDYIRSLGGIGRFHGWILFGLALGSASVALLPLLQKSWLSYYANHQAAWVAIVAIGIYGLIGIGVLVGNLINQLFWLKRGLQSSQLMHNKMLHSVLNAPIRFFDSTPVGRILQRFSRDIESVDVYLQWSFSSAVNCAFQVVVSICLILSLMPLMILVILPVMILYYGVQRDYRRPAREAKRFDSIGRSPRYAHFKESLQGLVVIRSYKKSDWFTQNFYDKLAHSQRMFYSNFMLNRWFSSRIPLIGGLISTSTAVGVALSAYYGVMNAGTAGLVTLYSLSFWSFLNWGIRIFADIESRMTSVERLKFFANLDAERSTVKTPTESLSEKWPEAGQIEVENLKVRYAKHLPWVLKGISFQVKAGTRVGIVGRTGSGKSTFFQSLFRFIEAEQGSIRVDGVDIASVPLEKLRENLAIIPQDPTLFLGTIRNNLDRYNKFTDEQIGSALKHASMWSYVQALPLGVDSPVTESGLNLSQGQRQLLCLARALLTNAKVIVMDEATASVDVQTDAQLQRVIRDAFHGVTMLIIAHRLGTIADCDQVVEIAAGEIKSIRKPSQWSTAEIKETLV
jgi:ABC-type multidrug transport system fused ATPase/permease subunit